MNDNIVFLSGVRTPFGRFGGSLKNISAIDLGVIAADAVLEKNGINRKLIDHVVFGNVIQTSGDAIYLARHIGLKAGLPIKTSALTVNRLCGSGFEAIIQGARLLALDEAKFVLVGGTENMSQAPHCNWNLRWGKKFGDFQLTDLLWTALTDSYCSCPMGLTAENLAEKYGISREESDEYSLLSQTRAKKAIEKGVLSEEIVPVEIKTVKKEKMFFEIDEHPKPETNLKDLSLLKPYFRNDGVVTAGSASGIVDGAAAMIMAKEEYARKESLKPIGRLISWGVAGCEPDQMGIGPVPASKIALKNAGLRLDQINLIEINEAFAPQYLAVEKELELDREKTNVNGGAISIGHPLGATGTRLTITLLKELIRQDLSLGLGAACIGGGQGIAVIVESLNNKKN